MVDTPTEKINIQLGDIIQIIAPDNPNLNLQQFYNEILWKKACTQGWGVVV